MSASELKALTKHILRVRKNLKRAQQPKDHRFDALVVFLWAGHDFNAAATYLRLHSEKSQEECQDEVAKIYIEMPPEQLLLMAMDPPIAAAVRAGTFMIERELHSWLRLQNSIGVAPGRLHLVRQCLNFLPQGLPARAEALLCRPFRAGARTQRKWLARFRHRWNARIGRVPVLPDVFPHEAAEKALNANSKVFDLCFAAPWTPKTNIEKHRCRALKP